jgi:hypothetical protein
MENIKFFKPKAHILKLLGEELIKSPIMAIYELVKNSYDADSNEVVVSFKNIENTEDALIAIEDNGTGLTSAIIENIWLEPGTDHRKPIDENGNRIINRSPIYDRVPMGEKGVGRFAVHKLGNTIKLVTRPANVIKCTNGEYKKYVLDYEITLKIDWVAFSQSKYLEEIPITWQTETDKTKFHFKNDSGTLIEVSALKEPWSRRMARSLKRNVVSMLSPKNKESEFKISLKFDNQWLADFPDANQILNVAPYKYTALLDDEFNLTVDYEFSFALNSEFGKRKIDGVTENIKGRLIPALRKELEDEEQLPKDKVDSFIANFIENKNPFGNILLELYSYDLDPATLRNYTYDSKTLKNVLKQHYGIKVFKNDMRVFNYGEPGNDWLELDIKRIQNKEWFSNNQNIGFIYLDSENSTSLVEKTNREGFIENDVYKIFYKSIIAILNDFKIERLKDRNVWLSHIEPAPKAKTYQDQTSLFKELIDSTDFTENEQKEKLKKEVDVLQKDFETKKETLLIPAGVGMTASVALHEIEKLVPRMRESVNSEPFKKEVSQEQVDELEDYVQGILSVLRKGGNKPIQLKQSIEKAISNYGFKFKSRDIDITTDFDESIGNITCDKRYFITMIMNIIDNSIYWLDTVYKNNKGIYLKTYLENDIPTIIIVDNGPGFKDDINEVVMPFFTRKEDGIGIGLYLIDTIMMKYGKLEISDNQELEDLNIPDCFRGAAVKLTFNKNQK